MAYATVTDLETRYGELDETQEAMATALLEDAAAMIDNYVEVDESDAQQLKLLKMVSCAMVNRAMAATAADSFGISNTSYTMGPFTQATTFSNPSGDLYFTASERSLLGMGGVVLRTIRPVIGGAVEDAC